MYKRQIKDLIKNLLEKLMLEERELYLEEHPTKENGYYTRDLLTLFGPPGRSQSAPGEARGVPPPAPPLPQTHLHRTFRGHPGSLRHWVQHPGHLPVFGVGVRGVLLPQSISRLTQVVEEEVKEWRNRPLAREYYAIYLDGTFLSVRRGKSAKEPVYVTLGIRPDGSREVLGFWLFGAEGESATNWRQVVKGL